MAEIDGDAGRVRAADDEGIPVGEALWAHSNVVAVDDADAAGDRLAERATGEGRELVSVPSHESIRRACRVADHRRP